MHNKINHRTFLLALSIYFHYMYSTENLGHQKLIPWLLGPGASDLTLRIAHFFH